MAAKIDLDEAAVAAILDEYGELPRADHWFYRGQEPKIPALAVAYIARKDADSYNSVSIDFLIDLALNEEPVPNFFTGERVFCTPRVLAGQELAARYVDELFDSWGISRTFEPSVKTWEFHDGSAAEARKKPFGARGGSWERESGVYYDNARDELLGSTDEFFGVCEVERLIEQALKICDEAREEFKNGKLDPDSWASSCGGMALTLRAHLEVGSTWEAMSCVAELSRLLTMHRLHEKEKDLEKRAKTWPSSGGKAKKTKTRIAEKVIQKVLELRATSNKSDSAIYAEVAKEPGLPKLSTIRRIMLEYASRK